MEHQQQQQQQQRQQLEQNENLQEELESLHKIIAMLSERIQQMESMDIFTYTTPSPLPLVSPSIQHEQQQHHQPMEGVTPIYNNSSTNNSNNNNQDNESKKPRDNFALIFPYIDINEPMKIQEEKVLRLLADTAPFIMWICDINGNPLFFNLRWYEFTGTTPDLDWYHCIHTEDQQRIIGTWLAYIQERKPCKIEYRVRRYDGVYRWMVGSSTPRYSIADGEFIGFTGTIIDITEMIQAKQQLKIFNEQQEALMHCSFVLLTKPLNINNNNNTNINNNNNNDNNNNLYQKQQQQQISPALISNANADTEVESADYFKIVLKSLSFTLLSDCAIMFLLDQKDPTIIRVAQRYNINPVVDDNELVIRLPVNYWQDCRNIYGMSSSEYDDVYSTIGRTRLEDLPSTLEIPNVVIHQNSSRLVCRPSIYSSFYEHYLMPLMVSSKLCKVGNVNNNNSNSSSNSESGSGLISLTAEYIKGTNNDLPFGFICVAARSEKEYNAGEQNTLRVMANIVSAYIKQVDSNKSMTQQQNLTATLTRSSKEAIIAIDASGVICEMNPSALQLFSMNQLQVKQKHPISVLFPFITESMRAEQGETFDHYISNYITRYRQHITFKETPATLLNGHQTFNVDLMIKEISATKDNRKYFIFIIRYLSNRSEIPYPIKHSIDSMVNMANALIESKVETKGVAESILRIISTLQSLVDNLINLSNLKLSTLKLKSDTILITDCVEQSLLLSSPTAQKYGVDLVPLYDNQLPSYIIGDMSLLRQIIIHLIEKTLSSTKDVKTLTLNVNLLNYQPTSPSFSSMSNNYSNNNNSNNDLHIFIEFDIHVSLSSNCIETKNEPYVDTEGAIELCKPIIHMMGGTIQTGTNGSIFNFSIPANIEHTTLYNSPALKPLSCHMTKGKKRILNISNNFYRRQKLQKVWNRFNCQGDFIPRFLSEEDIPNILESQCDMIFIDFSYDQSINEFINHLSQLRSQLNPSIVIVILIDSTFPHIQRITPFIDRILLKPIGLSIIESLLKH